MRLVEERDSPVVPVSLGRWMSQLVIWVLPVLDPQGGRVQPLEATEATEAIQATGVLDATGAPEATGATVATWVTRVSPGPRLFEESGANLHRPTVVRSGH